MSEHVHFKRCPKCGGEYPATTEYFHRDNLRKDGLFPQCRQCRVSKKYLERQQRKKQAEKQCSVCGQWFPATPEFFYIHRAECDGLYASCKSCALEASKREYRKPEQRMRVYNYLKERRAQPGMREIIRTNERERYKKPEVKARRVLTNKLSTIRHRDRYVAYQRAYHSNNRALRKQAPGSFTSQDVQRQYERQNGQCYWCTCKLDKWHVDHIVPIMRGGSNWPDNIVIACPHCNLSRNSKLPHEWPEGGKLL